MTTFRTHSVVIVPDYGHSAPDGSYDRGLVCGRYSELDVIDGYLPTLIEELDIDGIRFEVMNTRSPPGVAHDKRHTLIEPHSLVLHLGCGRFDGKAMPSKNISCVYFGGDGRVHAKELSEALFTWGQCYVYGHRAARPEPMKADRVINAEGAAGIRIEPFMLDGPDTDVYLSRLAELGTAIGRAVSSHLMVTKQARARMVIGDKRV